MEVWGPWWWPPSGRSPDPVAVSPPCAPPYLGRSLQVLDAVGVGGGDSQIDRR